MSDSADLLFELGTEELPPTALRRFSEVLQAEFVAGLTAAGLSHGEVQAYATPRRLALLVRDCLTRQPDRNVEKRGPAVKAAFDADGKPTRAAEGFASSCGVSVDALESLQTDKGEWLMYRVQESGQAATELLPGIAEQALARLPIPKRMRWGASEAQFVRPVHWLVFMLGDEVVPCELLDTRAGKQTRGHRFHHPAPISIDKPADYADVLRDTGFVIADFDARRAMIRQQVEDAASSVGGSADLDAALLDEVTALNEWPQPVACSFDTEFLAVPQEALVLTMKKNQKYFPLSDPQGRLINHFVTIANISSSNPAVIRRGNERVVRPRLADARFFWEQDGKKTLAAHAESLAGVVFQQQLGSMYEKSERVAALASHIARSMDADVELAARAGRLSRCDLMTEMVYEFPEMQGIMGRYQATRDGEAAELATAMDEFYMPRFAGDRLPQTPTGIAIALAERIDTLVGIFGIGQKPTGDKDPFALRRAALGALRILDEHRLAIDLTTLLDAATETLADTLTAADTPTAVYDFMLERLRGLYAERGVSNLLFDAVASVRPGNIADFGARITAVQAFSELPEAATLAAANKRIRNILKKSSDTVPASVDPALLELPAEQALTDAIGAAKQTTAPLFAAADYGSVLKSLAGLRPQVDAFFDEVMVNVEDAAVRRNRLALLASLARLFTRVADIAVLQE